MEASAFQKLKYYVRDMNRFQLYRHEWCIRNKWKYEDILEKYEQFHTRPYVMDLPLDEITYTVFDLETTGFFHQYGDEIISIGATKINISHSLFSEHYYELVRPIKEIPEQIQSLTGLSNEKIKKQGVPFPVAFSNFVQFSQGTLLVAYPASFDVSFLQELAKRWGFPVYKPYYLDAMKIAQVLYPDEKNSLDNLVKAFQIQERDRHHALNDAEMTSEVFMKLLDALKGKGITTYKQLIELRKNRSNYSLK